MLAGARGNLAARLEASEDWSAALVQRRAHVRLDPDSAEVQQALAAALLHTGDADAAVAALREARRLDATRADTRRLLAWVLATRPAPSAADGAEALRLAEEGAAAGDAADPVDLTTLAAAQAAAGRFDDALATTVRARAAAAGDAALGQALDDMQARFQRGEPYRDAP
jgi:spermidine synthase